MKKVNFSIIKKNHSTNQPSTKLHSFLKSKWLAIFGLILSVISQANASATYGQAADIFNIGAGARSMAMGSAFTAVADDASAPYFNPSGLAYLDEHQLLAMHAPLFLDTSYSYFSSAHPLGDKWGSIALSDALLLSSGYELRNEGNHLIDSNGSLRNNAIFGSYAHKLPMDLAAGVNVKLYQQKAGSFSDSTLGYDLGFMYRPSSLISVGAAFMNINTPEVKLNQEGDKIRPITKFGVASEVFPNKLILSADLVKTSQEKSVYAAGLEFRPHQLIHLRGGLNANRSYTFGIGINLKAFHIDYAFSTTDLGAFNKVSFTWAWHNIYKTQIDPPTKEGHAVFPLTGFENQVTFVTAVPSHTVAKWNLMIKDQNGKEVRSLGADLRPAERIVWDAKNNVGEPVVAGRYKYTFEVDYKNGKTWKVDGDIDLTLPNHNQEQVIDMSLQLNGASENKEEAKTTDVK